MIFTISGLGLIACTPISPRDHKENLPPTERYKRNQTSPNSDPETPSPIPVNQNTNVSEPAMTPANHPSNSGNSSPEILSPVNSPPTNSIIVIDKLKIPVAGVRPEDLRDTFKDARSEGRIHDAIDIMAPEDTPVLAAADGHIARFFDSERGGITIYQFSTDRKFVYYYAHLKRRAENLRENTPVKQGEVIGYVGDTGNAGPGNFHLHFAIWYVNDPKRYWEGTNLNPYSLLR